jgi:5S rRNA maturation endonuclease (ribonuclease M5)
MSTEKKSFVNVDELMPQVTLEQAALYYGVSLPELKKIGAETRTACFLNCGKDKATGDRALAIQTEDPAKKFRCHQYGCQKGGNLVSLCDLMKPGPNAGGRPRADRFKEIAKDLQAMASGEAGTAAPSILPATPALPTPHRKVNVPLKESDNERARGLIDLDRKFLVDVADMSPSASGYFRRRPFLSPDVCRASRMGYLPRDVGGEDKSGGTLRGKVTYAYLSETGDVLCFFGRDPDFEEKHQKWEVSDKTDKEPAKFAFPKGFHRGIELYGQHLLGTEAADNHVREIGLILVEGPNDAIRLHTLGVPALALCSNAITREQAAKAAEFARKVSGGFVTVLLDCDTEGLTGMKQCLGYLAQLVPVRLAWTDKMFAGKFRGRQPESLSLEEWTEMRNYLVCGKAEGWSL